MSDKFSFGSQIGAGSGGKERNWLPLGVAAVLVAGVVTAGLLLTGRPGRHVPGATAVEASAPLDSYAASLPLTNIVMSESSNLAGGKVTYVDGHIVNTGTRTVTAVSVQVLFRNSQHEIAENQTMPLTLIRTREPYIDTEPVSAAPLKPGAQQDFRLNLDQVSPEWDGAYPEVRIIKTETRQ